MKKIITWLSIAWPLFVILSVTGILAAVPRPKALVFSPIMIPCALLYLGIVVLMLCRYRLNVLETRGRDVKIQNLSDHTIHLSPEVKVKYSGKGSVVNGTKPTEQMKDELHGLVDEKSLEECRRIVVGIQPTVKQAFFYNSEAMKFEGTDCFLVYGHDNKGKGVIVEVQAENGADALGKAQEQRPDCKFNHTNLK